MERTVLARTKRAIAGIRECSPMIGWRWAVADRVLKRLGIKEVKRRAKGLAHPIVCRVATGDIFEYTHLLGWGQVTFDLPIVPSIIIDAGANVGYSALRFQKEFPGATIIGLEPEGHNADQFERNCKPYHNIKLERKALWATDTRLRIRSLDAGTSAFQVVEDPTGEVEGISINSLMTKYGLPRIDLLKIDIEGSEKAIFSNPRSKTWLPAVSIILVETHDRFEPGCSEVVDAALADRFDYRGIVDEYAYYTLRSLIGTSELCEANNQE
jgi:FkbM family methyltransferase